MSPKQDRSPSLGGILVTSRSSGRITITNSTDADRVARMLRHVRDTLARELELSPEELDVDAPFVELGLDSIAGVIWIRRLNADLGTSFTVGDVYSHPTVAGLTASILSALPSEEVVSGSDSLPEDSSAPDSSPRPLDPFLIRLRDSLARELEVDSDDLDVDVPFVELGVDSVTGVTWTRAINRSFGLSLTATSVYSHSTLADLAAAVGDGGNGAVAESTTVGPPTIDAPTVEEAPAQEAAPPAAETQPQTAQAHEPLLARTTSAAAAGQSVRIAIVGMAGAFAGADDVDQYWRNIVDGRDSVSEVPLSRWSVDDLYDPQPGVRGRSSSKWMGVLSSAAEFDPLFFGISPAEAEQMDPQQRLLLRETWRCLEDAGRSPRDLAGTQTGVFVGCTANGYGGPVYPDRLSAHQNLGMSNAVLAGRVSYTFDLRGPCQAIDTSCSSSLVAIATACDSLLTGASETAIAGGVMVLPGPGVHVAMSQLRALSPRGHCSAFDARADGFVPGEGVGVVLLKRLDDAIRDGDRVRAVITAWGTGQDGRSNGITAPRSEAQADLVSRTHLRFGIDPATIGLVEAHGTGTALGDPVEIEGLVAGFAIPPTDDARCALGSVKSNIGHTASAAGVAGLIKAVSALEHAVLPPTVEFSELNPHIDLSGTPFFVNTVARPWVVEGTRTAAVNAFGYSGTNAHLVLEESPVATERPDDDAGDVAIVLSARTPEQLRRRAEQLRDHLRTSEQRVRDVAFTLLVGRAHFAHRLAFTAADAGVAASVLDAWTRTGSHPAVITGVAPRVPTPGPVVMTTVPVGAARAWAVGQEVDADTLFAGSEPQRVALPSYPFAREEYWLVDPTGRRSEPVGGAATDVVSLQPQWEPVVGDRVQRPRRTFLWLAGTTLQQADDVAALLPPGSRVRTLRSVGALGEGYADAVVEMHDDLAALVARGDAADVTAQLVVVGASEAPVRAFAGLDALLRSASLEHPTLRCRTTEFTGTPSAREIADVVGCQIGGTARVRIDGPRIEELRLAAVADSEAAGRALPWRRNGVVLVAGGTGGIGRAVAEHLAAAMPDGVVVAVSRTAAPDSTPTAVGSRIVFETADLADPLSVARLVERLVAAHGPITGVINCAGELRDGFLTTKGPADIRTVLESKVAGTTALDAATRDQPLDFFVGITSTAGTWGSVGQADYASANAFVDAYMRGRAERTAVGGSAGVSCALALSLVDGGGMTASDGAGAALAALGLRPLGVDDVLRALDSAVRSGRPGTVVVAGDPTALLERWSAQTATAAQSTASTTPGPDATEVWAAAVTAAVSAQLAVSPDDLTTDDELGAFGFDSISLTELADTLNGIHGTSLLPTVFFEFRTIRSLSAHLAASGSLPTGSTPNPTPPASVVPAPGPPAPPHTGLGEQDAPQPAVGSSRSSRPATRPEDIAVIGMSGVFPGADDIDGFWRGLVAGQDSVTEVPAERWDWRAGSIGTDTVPDHQRWGGFIDGIDRFDPLFFGISPREARSMDPQQRLLLTHAWQALEDAGHAPSTLAGSDTAVFAGTAPSGYAALLDFSTSDGGHPATGLSGSIGPNRVSYLLDLHGPSEPVETACSSSLVALHRAVTALRSGRSRFALVGGVNTMVDDSLHSAYGRAGMLAEDGRCKVFSSRADGYVRGEGAAVLVLRPLADAEQDHDRILCVIRGTAENHGGRSHSLTAPNPAAQTDVVRAALDDADVDAESIGYVETHGTGTVLGDPIEVAALSKAFLGGSDAPEQPWCVLGSVKSNIGHLELAAGVASVVKVVRQLQSRIIVPSLNSSPVNEHLRLAETPFTVAGELRPWTRLSGPDGRDVPRRAGVSSFGFGGVNAHAVLEEYVDDSVPSSDAGRAVLVVLSADDDVRLRATASRLEQVLARAGDDAPALGDVAFTLQVGRDHRSSRAAIVVSDRAELLGALGRLADGEASAGSPGGPRWQRGVAAHVPIGAIRDLSTTTSRWRGVLEPGGDIEGLAAAWCAGEDVDWYELHPAGDRPRRTSLPPSVLADESYWPRRGGAQPDTGGAGAPHDPLDGQRTTAGAGGIAFLHAFDGSEPFLRDHRIGGTAVLPASAHLEVARRAVAWVAERTSPSAVELHDFSWLRPAAQVSTGLDVVVEVQLVETDRFSVSISTVVDGVTMESSRCSATVGRAPTTPSETIDVAALWADTTLQVDDTAFYDAYAARGMGYGTTHRTVRRAGLSEAAGGPPTVVADLVRQHAGGGAVLDPGLVDGALQSTLMMTWRGGAGVGGESALPFALRHVRVHAPSSERSTVTVRLGGGAVTPDLAVVDVSIWDDRGRLTTELLGLTARRRPQPLTRRDASPGLLTRLRTMVADAAGIDPARVETDATFDRYGMDSMLAMSLTRVLERAYGTLPKTLLFEVKNIRGLHEWLVENRPGTALQEVVSTEAATPTGVTRVQDSMAARSTAVSSAAAASPGRRPDRERIAVVGLAGRYPAADDVAAFWDNLRAGRDSVSRVSGDRWRLLRGGLTAPSGTPGGVSGGFLDGVDEFDPLHFGISPREAEFLDPQERLFLQCAHHAVEDAGYSATSLSRVHQQTGVYVGVMYEEYQLYGAQAQERGRPIALSGSAASIANRVSYTFGLSGPSLAVDTMCSSSSTAIHLACEALRRGEIDAALAGGVNVSVHPNKYLLLDQGGFASSDGHCRSFGAGGDGYVPGEAVGAVVLKRLDQARHDGDHVYGVIEGSAVGHGGRTHGFSVPDPVAQGDVLLRAWEDAGIDAREIDYVEAHGTGTALGDPIEIAGLARAFSRAAGGAPDRCAVGSVKSNIGHTESAAGVAGLTKVLLQLQHHELVPSLHSDEPNPFLDLDGNPLEIQRRLDVWHAAPGRTAGRVAGLSSFGAGGSNTHMVVSEADAPERALTAERPEPELFVVSARTPQELVHVARRLAARLQELPESALADVAWTLQDGRAALEHRRAFVASSLTEARAVLADLGDGVTPATVVAGRAACGEVQTSDAVQNGVAAVAAVQLDGSPSALLRLARAWASGATVAWHELPSSSLRARVSLPGYPFARERYWYTDDGTDTGPALATDRGMDAAHGTGIGSHTLGARPPVAPLVLAPVLVPEAVTADPDRALAAAERIVLVVGQLDDDGFAELVAASPRGVRIERVRPRGGPVDVEFRRAADALVLLLQSLQHSSSATAPDLVQVLTVASVEADFVPGSALAAMLLSAQQERDDLRVQCVTSTDGATGGELAERLLADAGSTAAEIVHRGGGRRYVRRRRAIDIPTSDASAWHDDGLYVVAGGAGALGLEVLRRIAADVERAVVVLVGRSGPSSAVQDAIATVRRPGLVVEYRRADVGRAHEVEHVCDAVRAAHGPITGVVLAAGVLRDALLVRSDPADLAEVFAPKVTAVVAFDEATRADPLRLFLAFSSSSGSFGNAGQTSYAAANRFVSDFASQRAALVHRGERQGRTLAVDWPLWADGGMAVPDSVDAWLTRSGQRRLTTDEGFDVLRDLVHLPTVSHVVVLVGDLDVLRDRLVDAPGAWVEGPSATPPVSIDRAAAPEATSPATPSRVLSEDVVLGAVRERIGAALKLDVRRIEADVPLERYGLESVVAAKVTSDLGRRFWPLPATLFFEATTARAVARHIIRRAGVVAEPAAGTSLHPATQSAPAATPEPDASDAEDSGGVTTHPVAPPRRTAAAEPVAVIAVSGDYPGPGGVDGLWEMLSSGGDAITEVPADRWDADALHDADRDGRGTSVGKWGSFLIDVDRFDAVTFGTSPREAAAMDPQQRLFLETSLRLLEFAGVTQAVLEDRYARRVGVFVGSMYRMYGRGDTDLARRALVSSSSLNMIANRVSHHFGLEGPSTAVDSMCSSSALAIHLACAALRAGECDLAIAGGVNLTLDSDKFVSLSQAQMLASSPDSRSFRDGDGYLPGEAVGAVLLKRASEAEQDDDDVLALVTGSATRHGGRASGFMTPSRAAQVSTLDQALVMAGLTAEDIGYVEAAANGAALADAVEFGALREVFEGVQHRVAVGTVKSALGHPEGASGIAQLTKVLLQLRHRRLVPLTTAGDDNPHIDRQGTMLKLVESDEVWEAPAGKVQGTPLRALVNSVGAGGTSVALVVESPPVRAPRRMPSSSVPSVVVLSGLTPEHLRLAVGSAIRGLEARPDALLADVAFTLQTAREHTAHRLAIVASSRAELLQAWRDLVAAGPGGVETVLAAGLGGVFATGPEGSNPLSHVFTGAAGRALVETLLDEHDPGTLAEAWVRGAVVPWEHLASNEHARRIDLPTTPLLRRRHWIDVEDVTGASATPDRTVDEREPNTSERPTGPGAVPADRASVLAFALDLLADALGTTVSELSADGDARAWGVDSIVWSRLQRGLRKRFGVELSAREIARHRTLSQMLATLPDGSGAPTEEACGPADPSVAPREGRLRTLRALRDGEIDVETAKTLLRNDG
ncbi:hypothetical protein A6122_0774 [Rathayibacter tritici]|uniref:Uncharacterized protein n=2 Tax=Rathayibacter tritici TaxID=33888 RepID=A0A160KRG9_9MICO|nr:hypothetical protein A6122_0774 [Rathayibacter tritici]